MQSSPYPPLNNPVLIMYLCKRPPHTVSVFLTSKLLKGCHCPSLGLLKPKAMYKLKEYSEDTANKILKNFNTLF